MALFYYLLKNNFSFDVAHLNYHLREESNYEEINLKKYCEKNQIKIFVKEVFYKIEKDKNVEKWARDERYNFFKKIYLETKAYDSVLIAHNLDDLIETYFIQKSRGGYFDYYGLKEKIIKDDVVYIRPLLNYRKKELYDYCLENSVPFNIDKSNYDNSYLRNNLRNNLIVNYDNKDIRKILSTIKKLNSIKDKKNKYFNKIIFNNKVRLKDIDILSKNPFFYNLYKDKNDAKLEIFIDIFYYLLSKNNFSKPFSVKEIKDIYEKIKLNKKVNIKLNINNKYFIYEYGKIKIKEIYNFSYNFIVTKKGNELFSFFSNKTSRKFFNKYGYNFLIKPILVNEEFFYFDNDIERSKSAKKAIKDMKLPTEYRNIYPGIYEIKTNKLIYIPRYMEKVRYTKKSLLKFNLEKIIDYFSK